MRSGIEGLCMVWKTANANSRQEEPTQLAANRDFLHQGRYILTRKEAPSDYKCTRVLV